MNTKKTITIPEGEVKAFLQGVKVMTEKLSQGKIDQVRLQQFYFDNYSYNVLKQLWLSYLSNKNN